MRSEPACDNAGRPGPRVLFVHQASDLYGSDRVLLEIAHALRQAGGEPIVVLPEGGPLVAALLARGIETHPVPPAQVGKLVRSALTPAGLWRLLRALPGCLRTLDACVAGRRVDWVHSNTLAVLGGAWWAARRGVRHVWHVHEIVARPCLAAQGLPWLVQAGADSVVCNSHATQRWLVGAAPALGDRTRVIWNGVPDPPPHRHNDTEMAALRGRFRPTGTRLAVGLVGRINRMKGHEQLLAAAEWLNARGTSDFSIVFVGSPPPGQPQHLQRLRERIARSSVAARVVLQGFMPEPQAAYAALDIVCVPSTEPEAFGLIAVEAMAAGRAVIASRTGGLPEVVVDGQTGYLHARGDPLALAQRLAALLEDGPRRLAFGRAGRQRYEAEFELATMTRQWLDLLSAPAPATPPVPARASVGSAG
jgi:glycosyltransferase involved in cell wall biosynthesis